tara:strand:- start:12666 stop:13748 length:1083 start_codon:yes stop_codon:yes gene_type:complete
MTIEFNWALCSTRAGDGKSVIQSSPERSPTLEYLVRVTSAAEQFGFRNILVPTGTHCIDPWTLSSAIAGQTKKIKFLIAFRPGLIGPTYAAQQISSFCFLNKDRISLNVVAGSNSPDLKRYGYHLEHDLRYKVNDEFMELTIRLLTGNCPVSFKGNYFSIQDAVIFPILKAEKLPEFFMAGASEGAKKVAAKYGDVHVVHAIEPDEIEKDIKQVTKIASRLERNRKLTFCIRHLVCVRETKKEAKKAAEEIVKKSIIKKDQNWGAGVRATESVTQRRVSELANKKGPWLKDSIYMGVNNVRQGAGTMIVGTPEMVASQIKEYIDAGVSRFIMNGWPHLEEAENFGKEVIPLLKDIKVKNN